MVVENFLELVDIIEIEKLDQYKNMIDLSIDKDESFILSNGLISHNSSMGSLLQARNSDIDAVYALRGKVKHAKKLSDLTNNSEILDLMNILNIEPHNTRDTKFKKIIIATDSDSDGYHITCLIINLFNHWFPHIIENAKLYSLVTPLVVCNEGSNRLYFYSLEEFEENLKKKKLSNINYLKGLGSLSIDDWKYVMSNMVLFNIVNDKNTEKYLDIAFGDSTLKRKQWLSGK